MYQDVILEMRGEKKYAVVKIKVTVAATGTPRGGVFADRNTVPRQAVVLVELSEACVDKCTRRLFVFFVMCFAFLLCDFLLRRYGTEYLRQPLLFFTQILFCNTY